MGFARLAESTIRNIRGKGEKDKLAAWEKILSSTIGGALATWNQPIEVVRVEVRIGRLSSYVKETYCYTYRCNLCPKQPLRLAAPRS